MVTAPPSASYGVGEKKLGIIDALSVAENSNKYSAIPRIYKIFQ